jgi:hypothetical protein
MVELLFGAWRKTVRPIKQLQLWEVLKRRGTSRLANANPQALGFAVERCMGCRHLRECDRLLAVHWDTGLGEFCPNAMYLGHLDAMKHHAAARRPIETR